MYPDNNISYREVVADGNRVKYRVAIARGGPGWIARVEVAKHDYERNMPGAKRLARKLAQMGIPEFIKDLDFEGKAFDLLVQAAIDGGVEEYVTVGEFWFGRTKSSAAHALEWSDEEVVTQLLNARDGRMEDAAYPLVEAVLRSLGMRIVLAQRGER